MERFDLIVIGGGPAGAAAGITAARAGKRALLLERGRFPRQKVCGEFISSEATGLLRELLGTGGTDLLNVAPVVSEARLFADGRTLSAPLSPPALSLPRFALDQALWHVAEEAGCVCRQETQVDEVTHPDRFEVRAGEQQWQSDTVVSASGRWSNLTRAMQGPDAPRWLGAKGHFREAHPHPSVDLYFFDGGYCGVQSIGDETVNACAMVRGDVASTLDQVFARHPELWRRTRDWAPISEPVATAPLVFRNPAPIGPDGVLNAGDAAGFIDPFAGDGIAIALRSGAKAAIGRADEYARWYTREILPAFRAAARFRRLMSTPAWARTLALSLLGSRRVAAWAVRATRSRG
jgi:flavin-dependent dehydrogenase